MEDKHHSQHGKQWMKLVEGKAPQKQNWKLPSKKKDFKKERTFQKSVGNSPKITDKPTKEIINNQLDIKLEEIYAVLKKMKSRKFAGFEKILPEVWKTRKFDNIVVW